MNTAQAKALRIDEYLSRLGYSPRKVGEKGCWYLSMLALKGEKTPSFQVSADGHAFHDWSTGASGSIVDLAMCIIRKHDVSSALAHIEATMGCTVSATASCSFSLYQQKKSFEILSVASLASPALLYYANSRSISTNITSAYCKEVRYRNILTGKEYYSLGWPNDAGGWELRNRYSKLAAAPKDISTVNDLGNCTMLVFEGFFDFLSAVQMGWFRGDEMNGVVLNSTALVDKALPVLANAKRVVCLLDNDDSGRKATGRIIQFCPQAEDYSCHYAGCCDLNDYLMNNAKIRSDMNNIDFQGVGHTDNRNLAVGFRNPAEENRANAAGTSTDAPSVVINNMAQINIQNIVYADKSSYNNGHFIPVFQDAIRAIACNGAVKPGTRRVLDYILGTVDENNCICDEIVDIANNLCCSEDTVERAIKQLVTMHIICKKEGARDHSLYELSDKILNPRLAFKGNTRKLHKDALPILLDPGTIAPLIPTLFDNQEF